MISSPKLERLNLEENPLTRETEVALKGKAVVEAGIEVAVSEREQEEWEDLTL